MLKKVLLFCLVLLLPSFCFGQQFVSKFDSTLYSNSSGSYIPHLDTQAVLLWSYTPANNTAGVPFRVLSAEIAPSFSLDHSGYFISSNGYSKIDYANDVRYWATVIDSTTIYGNTARINSIFLPEIQGFLEAKGLGTVQQRAALIRSFHSGPVQILNIDNLKKSILNALSPFLNIYLGIFLTLFVVDLMSKKSKDVIAESAKIQRRAERAQQRREIRADPTAQIFEFRLANFSSIASGSVSDPSISRRKARRLFEDTALEYAEYKKSRGWKY